jgi:hypothetical protein
MFFKRCPYPYDRYAINVYDIAIDLVTGEIIVPTLGDNTDYPGWSMIRSGDTRTRTVHVHRLKALTFLENKTGLPFEQCQVDHINGDKLDTYLGNLEIVTPQENKARAYRTGLRNDNKRIRLVNTKTDEEIICYSQAEAARIIGVHPSSFCEYLSKYGDKIVYRDFYIERVL